MGIRPRRTSAPGDGGLELPWCEQTWDGGAHCCRPHVHVLVASRTRCGTTARHTCDPYLRQHRPRHRGRRTQRNHWRSTEVERSRALRRTSHRRSVDQIEQIRVCLSNSQQFCYNNSRCRPNNTSQNSACAAQAELMSKGQTSSLPPQQPQHESQAQEVLAHMDPQPAAPPLWCSTRCRPQQRARASQAHLL